LAASRPYAPRRVDILRLLLRPLFSGSAGAVRAPHDGIVTFSHARNWIDYGFIGVSPSGERVEGEQELLRRQCLKRKLVPADIARTVLFFAAEDSGACTNQNYIVDGGWV